MTNKRKTHRKRKITRGGFSIASMFGFSNGSDNKVDPLQKADPVVANTAVANTAVADPANTGIGGKRKTNKRNTKKNKSQKR